MINSRRGIEAAPPDARASYQSGAHKSQQASFPIVVGPTRAKLRPFFFRCRHVSWSGETHTCRAATGRYSSALQVATATCPRLGTKLTSGDVACTLSVRARDLLRIVCTPRKQ
ncbi:hypothetical protein AAC387_Pa03g3198 [Persea americana]